MEKTYFYHKFKVEMPIRNGYYDDFVSFLNDFCSLRDLRVEWLRCVEFVGYTSVTFILRGDYMIPSTLVSLGQEWRSRMAYLTMG